MDIERRGDWQYPVVRDSIQRRGTGVGSGNFNLISQIFSKTNIFLSLLNIVFYSCYLLILFIIH